MTSGTPTWLTSSLRRGVDDPGAVHAPPPHPLAGCCVHRGVTLMTLPLSTPPPPPPCWPLCSLRRGVDDPGVVHAPPPPPPCWLLCSLGRGVDDPAAVHAPPPPPCWPLCSLRRGVDDPGAVHAPPPLPAGCCVHWGVALMTLALSTPPSPSPPLLAPVFTEARRG